MKMSLLKIFTYYFVFDDSYQMNLSKYDSHTHAKEEANRTGKCEGNISGKTQPGKLVQTIQISYIVRMCEIKEI